MEHDKVLQKDIHQAAQILREGGLIAFPTETYYGLGVDPFNEKALQELFAVKKRPAVKPVLVLVNDQVKLMRNLDEDQSIYVEIYYEGRNLVYSETIKNDGMIGKVFDFSGSASGEYLFSINYENRNHSEYLSINTIY